MPDADRTDTAAFAVDLLQDISRRVEESRLAEHDIAVAQVLEHIRNDPRMSQHALPGHPAPDA